MVSEQSVYNLTTRTVELEVVPVCREYRLGLIPWSPLSGGLLAGKITGASQGRRATLQPDEETLNKIERYEKLCGDLGEEPANISLAWLLHNPVVTAPIIGPRTIEQLETAMRAAQIELSPGTLAQIDEIFPGPGGEAPEAYAW